MFTVTPPEELVRKLREDYAAMTGRYPSPSDVEDFLISLIAYNRSQLEGQMNYYRKQNFLRYATGEALDLLGEWLGVKRLPPEPAVTTVRLYFETPHPQIVLDTEDVKVVAPNQLIFKPQEPLIVPENVPEFDALFVCETPGSVGNGFLAGELRNLLQPVPYVKAVENITITAGGKETEDDEHLRDRIRLAPYRFNTAGTKKGYIYWAKTASASVIDVSVLSPSPGVVEVYVLTDQLPVPTEILSKVEEILSAEDVRPLTDYVVVKPAEPVEFTVDVEVKIASGFETLATQILDKCQEELDNYIAETKRKLGQPINPDQIIYRLMGIQGVFYVKVNSPTYTELKERQVGVGKVKGVKILS